MTRGRPRLLEPVCINSPSSFYAMSRLSVAERERRYESFWKRRCAQVFRQTNEEDPHVDVYRYAPTRIPWARERRCHVYITGGMTERMMPVATGDEGRRVRRVELCACTRTVRDAEPGRDAVAWALRTLAHLPWREGISLMPLETVTWGGRILAASGMSAFFLAIPPADEDEGLRRAANADLVLQVMTIREEERAFAVREGSVALVDRFEAAGIAPLIDWDRPSCVERAP